MPLPQIGFWELRRGGAGVSSHHVHEIAHHIQTNKTKLSRYDHVSLIELIGEDRQRHLDLNRDLCETDELTPQWPNPVAPSQENTEDVTSSPFSDCHVSESTRALQATSNDDDAGPAEVVVAAIIASTAEVAVNSISDMTADLLADCMATAFEKSRAELQ